VTRDDALFAELVAMVSHKGRSGQRFLKKVRQQLLDTGRDEDSARIKILEELD
jgi:hypothetical protein